MTQKSQHTPGPWQPMDSGLVYAPPPKGEDEATLICDVGEIDETTPDRVANAFLIAAAPDMLDALEAQTEAAQAVIDSWSEGDLAGAVRMLDASLADAQAAIAKAKGGAT